MQALTNIHSNIHSHLVWFLYNQLYAAAVVSKARKTNVAVSVTGTMDLSLIEIKVCVVAVIHLVALCFLVVFNNCTN
jgi:hypothetical protein